MVALVAVGPGLSPWALRGSSKNTTNEPNSNRTYDSSSVRVKPTSTTRREIRTKFDEQNVLWTFATRQGRLRTVDRPEAPADGHLIETLRKAMTPPLTLKDAATEISISDRRWRQIETGYRIEGGSPVPVHAPADTLARMAKVVGASPAQLRAAGREDAAGILEMGTTPTRRASGGTKRVTSSGGPFSAEESALVSSAAVHQQRIAMRVASLADTEQDPERAAEIIAIVNELIAASAVMSHLVARSGSVEDSVNYQSAIAELIARRNRALRDSVGGPGTTAEDIADQESRTHELLLRSLVIEKDRLERDDKSG